MDLLIVQIVFIHHGKNGLILKGIFSFEQYSAMK